MRRVVSEPAEELGERDAVLWLSRVRGRLVAYSLIVEDASTPLQLRMLADRAEAAELLERLVAEHGPVRAVPLVRGLLEERDLLRLVASKLATMRQGERTDLAQNQARFSEAESGVSGLALRPSGARRNVPGVGDIGTPSSGTSNVARGPRDHGPAPISPRLPGGR